MYAFVVVDPEDHTEGIIGFHGADGGWLPMVGADMKRVEALRPLAQRVATEMHRPVTLCVFERRREMELIQP